MDFETIYKYNLWGFGSGTGSVPMNNGPYMEFIQAFINEHRDIRTALDVGCGDWQISKDVDWKDIHYMGIDVVEEVIQSNIKRYSGEKTRFKVLDLYKDDIPDADLIIVRDVIHHLSNDKISTMLAKLDKVRYKYLLISGDVNRAPTYDIPDGLYRPVDIAREPFNLDCKEVLVYWERSIVMAFAIGALFVILFIWKCEHKHRVSSVVALVLILTVCFTFIPTKTTCLKIK